MSGRGHLSRHDARIRRMAAEGATDAQIAVAVGSRANSVYAYRARHRIVGTTRAERTRLRRWLRAQQEAGPSAANPERTERPCLRCRERFDSEGIHNRICPGCTAINSRQSDIACGHMPAAPARAFR